jgi:hypothetical protein
MPAPFYQDLQKQSEPPPHALARQRARSYFCGAAAVLGVLRRFEEIGGEVLLFGGAIRDFAMNREPRDLDLVTIGIEADRIQEVLGRDVVRRTRFGGFHASIGLLHVDIWPIAETWAIRTDCFRPVPEDLPRTTFLNIEAVAATLRCSGELGEFYDAGFSQSLERRFLEINYGPNPYPELSAIRAMVLAEHTGFRVGECLAQYVVEVMGQLSERDIENLQRDHYGDVILSAAAVLRQVASLQQ